MALSVVRSLVSAHGRQVVALGLATTGSALAYYHAPFEPATRVLVGDLSSVSVGVSDVC